ncbi:hypothetical protein [Streptomyces triticagri]|nr:hypothetical protein [Streptomyces triticagri]
MPRVHLRHRRAVTALLGVLFVALAAGLFCGPAGVPEQRIPVPAFAAAATAHDRGGVDGADGADARGTAATGAAASAYEAGRVAPDGGFGCGKGKSGDADAEQSAPVRGSTVAEHLSAFAHAQAALGLCAPEAYVPGPAQDRGPPPVEPPTPVTLSVLRV